MFGTVNIIETLPYSFIECISYHIKKLKSDHEMRFMEKIKQML